MELRHLRYFVAVAEVENVSLAAEQLHVSQPPLSRQIHQLEEELGVALFKRTAKSLHLTDAGKLFAREANLILRHVDRAIAATREVAGTSHRELQIGYAPSLTVKILPRTLRKLQSHKPLVKIHLHDLTTTEMLKRLKSRSLDLALVVHPGNQALRGFAFHELFRHPACVVLPVSHPAAKKSTIPIKTLTGENVIAFTRSDYPEYHRWLASIYKPTRKRPKVTEEHDSITSLIAAVEAGNGIAFGADGFQELAGSRLRVIPLTLPAPPILVGAAHNADTTDKLITNLVATLNLPLTWGAGRGARLP